MISNDLQSPQMTYNGRQGDSAKKKLDTSLKVGFNPRGLVKYFYLQCNWYRTLSLEF